MWRSVIRTTPSWAPVALRLALAAIFLFHGSGKLFGLFGGRGIEGTAGGFEQIGLKPAKPLAILAGGTEFFGGLALLLGLLTRPAALGIACVMAVAIAAVHGKNGFSLQKGGFEYCFALLMMCAALLVSGGGMLSLDALLSRWKSRKPAS